MSLTRGEIVAAAVRILNEFGLAGLSPPTGPDPERSRRTPTPCAHICWAHRDGADENCERRFSAGLGLVLVGIAAARHASGQVRGT